MSKSVFTITIEPDLGWESKPGVNTIHATMDGAIARIKETHPELTAEQESELRKFEMILLGDSPGDRDDAYSIEEFALED